MWMLQYCSFMSNSCIVKLETEQAMCLSISLWCMDCTLLKPGKLFGVISSLLIQVLVFFLGSFLVTLPLLLSNADRINGAPISSVEIKVFDEFIVTVGLCTLKSVCHHFSWRKGLVEGKIASRILLVFGECCLDAYI